MSIAGYTGVNKAVNGRYNVYVSNIYFGCYDDPIVAAGVYNHFALIKWGSGCKINDVPEVDTNFIQVVKRRENSEMGYIRKVKNRWVLTYKEKTLIRCDEQVDAEIYRMAFNKVHELITWVETYRKLITRDEDGNAIIRVRISAKDGRYSNAIVDDDKWHELNQYSWFTWGKKGRYVLNEHSTLMHKLVFGREVADGNKIDHINRNPVDNRMSNLREASSSTNGQNAASRPGREGKRGVTESPNGKRFYAAIRIKGKMIQLGSYVNNDDAARAYDQAVMKYHGGGALNFPVNV